MPWKNDCATDPLSTVRQFLCERCDLVSALRCCTAESCAEINAGGCDLSTVLFAGGSLGGSALLSNALGIDALTAGNAAANQVLIGYLDHHRPAITRHSENEQYEAAATDCSSGDSSDGTTQRELASLSAKRDAELCDACSGSSLKLCNGQAKEAMAICNIVRGSNGQCVYANSMDSGVIRFVITVKLRTPS